MAENYSNNRPRRGPGARMMPGEKAKDFKGTMAKLIKYIGGYKWAVLVVLILAVGSTIFAIMGPKILGNATTEIFNGFASKFTGGDGIDFGKVAEILIFLICIYCISAVFSMIQGLLMANVAQKISYRMRKELIEKINHMPMDYFEKRTHGEVLSRITNDVDTLGMNLNQSLTQLITSVTTLIGVTVMMLSISPLLTLITFMILPISMIFIGTIVKKSQKHFKAQQEYLGHVNGQVEEVFSGHNIVKAYNREDEVTKEFTQINQTLYESAWKSQFLSGLMMPIMNCIGNLGYVAVAIVGGLLAAEGTITVGNIQSFIQYVKTFTQPITQMAQVSNMLQSTAAAAERVFEFMDEAEESQVAENHAPMAAEKLEGNVEFKGVKFGYDPEKIIIKNFNAKVKKGQKIAIVGPTGAGKTTLVKLLMHFYDVNEGNISIDGFDIKDFDRSELREAFGMVLQDTWLFKGTIMENIRYGRLDATEEEVKAAAKAAYAHHFIEALPGGYNMELNEDATNISQGQRQLLTIARAILADNRILILDEATSSVDTRTEERIQMAMDNLMKGRTSFVIAHRLSTIKNADLILVLKDGDVIEQGNHEELLAAQGFYANLYNSQFEQTA